MCDITLIKTIFGVYPKQDIRAIKYFFTRHISQIRAEMQGKPFLACLVSVATVEQIFIQSTAMATIIIKKALKSPE